MPIIISMVPSSATEQACTQVREYIKKALEKEGILKNAITVEFTMCAFPTRLVVEYKSRTDHLRIIGKSDHEAEIVGKIIERQFKIPVECLVVTFPKEKTGLYVTSNSK